MRLSKIRIAGFKSFVDPVTLDLRSNLVGILGPNGCGKSNTIDAVRWVMGESSAKHLRGQSMEDVIFNGSSARKPVGLASVELVFDNHDGQLGGEYARFTEIAIKRQVSRDGMSKYFLNGARCRRRDITDIFLGTGLGPRSYAIIEQGTISRLIEAKPEELRNTLEEAAGISRYKDRRRETEARIASTRENLERLTDLRDELGKQLQKLDKQAKSAKKFKALREEERHLEALVLYLQWQDLQQNNALLVEKLAQTSQSYQAQLQIVQNHEASVAQSREHYSAANEHLNTIQGEYYQAGADISRIEQTIQFQKDNQQRQQYNLQKLQQALDETLQYAREDREKLQASQQQLLELKPESILVQEQIEQTEKSLFHAEQAAQDWQAQWQQLQHRLAEPARQAQVEKTRMAQLEQQLQQYQQRLDKSHQETQQLSDSQFVQDNAELLSELKITRAAHANAEIALQACTEQWQQQQQQAHYLQTELDQKRSRIQSLQGRLASLETLQQASQNKNQQKHQDWLKQQQLDKQASLKEILQVEAGWEQALEIVLDQALDMLTLDHLDARLAQLPTPESGLSLLETTASAQTAISQTAPPQTLAAKIIAPSSARTLLPLVYCVETLEEALLQHSHWADHQSAITRSGIWVGKHWIRWPDKQDAHNGVGVLQRQQDIRQLQEQLQILQASLAEQQQQQEHLREQTYEQENRRQHYQNEVNRLHRSESELNSRLHALQQRLDQMAQRRTQIQQETQDLQARQSDDKLLLEQATEQRNAALLLLESLEQIRAQLAAQREEKQQAVLDKRQQLRQLQEQQHKLHLAMENSRMQQLNSQQQLERVNQRLASLEQQRDELLEQMAQPDNLLEVLQAQRDEQRQARSVVELRLGEARQQLQHIQQNIQQQDEERIHAERQADTLRTQQEQLKLDWQTIQVRSQTLKEQLEQTGFDLDTLASTLTKQDHLADLQQKLQQLTNSIKRLGPINLAAIEEFHELDQRKTYLDQQNEDLVNALEMLETAIRKIDKETRTRFKATFEQVNHRLSDMFPRLFGGGECYLEMTGDNWLTTGIAIMAKPPGKRISSIYLMSGGEKALTAVALVFAIFELNPAPFCMLDEVDAPLDEANVGRFCELVRHMSERVQFIFITHNKTTMELADHLIGVTMREAGVSRLVSVDVAEAVKLAGE